MRIERTPGARARNLRLAGRSSLKIAQTGTFVISIPREWWEAFRERFETIGENDYPVEMFVETLREIGEEEPEEEVYWPAQGRPLDSSYVAARILKAIRHRVNHRGP